VGLFGHCEFSEGDPDLAVNKGGVMETRHNSPYEPPRLKVLGSVHELTQSIPAKVYGGADGAMYNQQSVSWTS
jgi:alanine dehydrogenase